MTTATHDPNGLPVTAGPASTSHRKPATAKRRRAIGAALIAVALAVGSGAGVLMTQHSSETVKPGMVSAQMVSMQDSPAVQLVTDVQRAKVTTYDAVLRSHRLVHFLVHSRTGRADLLHGNFRALADFAVAEIHAYPSYFLAKGSTTTHHVSGTSSGSAFGVSSNGYLVTNAHVVEQIDAQTWLAWATEGDGAAASTATAISRSLASQLSHVGLPLNRGQVSTIEDTASNWVAKTSQVYFLSSNIHVGGGQSLKTTDPGIHAALVKSSGKTWPNADVAILKVNATNLPVIPLGDDATLETGDSVYALGYPYDASFGSGSSLTKTVTATVSSGQVTNRLHSPGGFENIEDSAPINHGNSGGALVNDDGEVVGITTAGDSNQDANGGHFFFAVPISVVTKYLTAAGITQLISPDQAIYNQAMAEMDASHYVAALAKLKQVEGDGFSTPYVMMHATMVEQAIAHGHNVGLPVRGLDQLTGALLALAVGLLAAGVGIAVIGRRRPAAAPIVLPAQPVTPVATAWPPFPTEATGARTAATVVAEPLFEPMR